MKINQNNDISLYRGETGAIDFKFSQRSDYYVPFLVSSARVNPMVCITIGSTRRESKNIINKQLWLELTNLPKFIQTTVEDLGVLTSNSEDNLNTTIEEGIMYQYMRKAEVDAGNPKLHFAYLANDVVLIDDYHFTVVLALDETITLDMTNVDYFYQIELMDTVPMLNHIQAVLNQHPSLLQRLPDDLVVGTPEYISACITAITSKFPDHWGYRIANPYTSPVARVSNIQMLQPPKSFTVQSVVK